MGGKIESTSGTIYIHRSSVKVGTRVIFHGNGQSLSFGLAEVASPIHFRLLLIEDYTIDGAAVFKTAPAREISHFVSREQRANMELLPQQETQDQDSWGFPSL